MTLDEHRLIDAALRLQEHRDKIAALRKQWRRCERIAYYDDDPDDSRIKALDPDQKDPCWKHNIDPDTGEHCPAVDIPITYCPSCAANEPIVRERKRLQRQSGGILSGLIRLARKVRAERGGK